MNARAPDPALKLVLASGSPRRRELLAQLGIVPHAVRAPDIDETPAKAELPRDYVRRIARQKAEASVPADDELVLCADTTVAMGRRILGKPADRAEAEAFLRGLSGRRHRVITAIAARRGDEIRVRDVLTAVRMKQLTERELARYLDSDDWQGKAGGYAIQGPAGALIPWINGSYTGVIGLPLAETASLLQGMGYVIGETR
ncbi:maf protein [Oceanicola granulosus HTCC2516]|uniref:dTTP/UTP pyrophosphatase n=1 Tax=Oceanicola granulosus (strain ATCC BAA-861 / DSM 15982 / KCTC 12143 / HTCC2516) TaxID=314256 RepID=Q2CB99_OCEGH|nr:Maf family protein [Oceanicola granulosus]EAR49940.1 maf protein [Oceanicola granulosus HTCC2516]